MPHHDDQGEERVWGQLRHGELRKVLVNEIASGKHPIGSRFPAETALQTRFGVGRHTVREALRALAEEGYIGRRQRSGTIVLAHESVPRYSQPVGSIQGLLELGSDTKLVVSEYGFAPTTGTTLFSMLEVGGSARDWQRLGGVREREGDEFPLCWSEIYIPKKFSIPRVRSRNMDDPIFLLLMQSHGLKLELVRQSIRAASIPDALAGILHVQPQSPGLLQMLKFYTPENTLFEASITLYPSDRYSFDAEIRRHKYFE
jgi:GntR family transcriptional regulator